MSEHDKARDNYPLQKETWRAECSVAARYVFEAIFARACALAHATDSENNEGLVVV